MSDFIRRERLYILLFVLVVLVNVAVIMPSAAKRRSHVTQETATIQAKVTAEVAKKANEGILLKQRELEERLKTDRTLAGAVNLATLALLAILCLGLLVDTVLLAMRSEGKRMDLRTYMPPGPVTWNLWDVVKVVVLFLFFGYMLVLTESFLAGVFPLVRNNSFRMILNSSILDILAAVFIIDIAVRQCGERLASLGLSFKNFARNVFYGIAGYLAAVPVLLAVLIVTAVLVTLFKYVPQKQAVVQLFMKEDNVPFLAYASFFAAIAGPIIEELFFRGFFYNALKKYTGAFWAMAASGAAFSLLHAHPVGFVPIMIIGMMLAYLYERTGTLVASITAHMIHNASMVGLVFLLKQLGV